MRTAEEQLKEVKGILSLFRWDFDFWLGPNPEDLMWNISETGELVFFVNSSDLFSWGYASLDQIKLEDVVDLKKAIEDNTEAIKDEENPFTKTTHGILLWLARKEGRRPQLSLYKCFNEKQAALFDACGPENTQYGRD